jgi:hypothetical protein
VGSSPTLGAQILSFKSCLFKQPAMVSAGLELTSGMR